MAGDRSAIESPTTAELIAWASPPCHECGDPIQRIEMRWHRIDGDGAWHPGPAFMVCANGHRIYAEEAV